MSAHFFIWLLRQISRLPLSLQALLGHVLGALLWHLARARKKVALTNIALCFPSWTQQQQQELAREHFQWLGRSIVERGMLWFASEDRLRQHIHIQGDIHFAERSEKPVMWLVLHFVGLEVAGAALQLFQTRMGVDIYQPQSNPIWDAALKKGRTRFGRGICLERSASIRPVIKHIREGHAFFNMPDMDFGAKDAAFVPFFGVPAATLLSPSRMAKALNMAVQPVIVRMEEGGRGYTVELLPPFEQFPSDDAQSDTLWLNRWIEEQVMRQPAQYLWVHKRFKTRPPGQASVYPE